MQTPILELKEVSKLYPGVKALDKVDFVLYPGEVRALLGENGAGKSTLIKIITGATAASGGELYFNGKKIEDNSPSKALELGISAVYQEFNLVPKMTVAENIFMGRFPEKNGMVDEQKMNDDASAVLKELGVEIDVHTQVGQLTVGYQQLVEIAKSVSKKIQVLIMDEPSAPLTNNEMKYLYQIVRKLKNDGVSIIYISHRLEEVFEVCDAITVFRDGQYVGSMSVSETNQDELISLMVNRKLGDAYPHKDYVRGKKVLEVRGLCTEKLKDVSFSAYEGEILGFAGLIGAGRTDVARAVFGADPCIAGKILIDGKVVSIHSPQQAVKHGIGLIPEDRKRHGTLQHMSVKDNITYSNLTAMFHWGMIRRKKEISKAQDYVERLRIKTPSLKQLVRNLSGGNQQKVVLAKWMLTNLRVLIFDEPTRGIDVGAKQEIYQLMIDLVTKGIVVIMISSEMGELLGLSDRIIVMHEGQISGELKRKDASQEKILSLASMARREGER